MRIKALSRGRKGLADADQGSATFLGISRVIYLGLVGIGFLLAAQVGDPAEIGTYSLVVAVTAIVTVVAQAGIDRLLLVEVSQLSAAQHFSWRVWWQRRIYSVILIVVCAIPAAIVDRIAIPAAFLILSRLILGDLENIGLGRKITNLVAQSTLANGIISAVAIALAGQHSASTLVWASSVGNVVASCIIICSMRKRIPDDVAGDGQLTLRWAQAMPFAGMAVAAAVYQRADLTMMGLFGLGIAQLAGYAIALRAFEALVAFRGAVVQHEATKWANQDTSSERVRIWSAKICAACIGLGFLVILVSLNVPRTGLLSQYEGLWTLVAVIGIGTPLIGSHTVTSTWIYSKPGSYRTMGLSVALSCMSIILTIGAILIGGIIGVAAAASIKEYVSYLAFRKILPSNGINLRAALEVLMWPAATLVLCGVYLIGRWLIDG